MQELIEIAANRKKEWLWRRGLWGGWVFQKRRRPEILDFLGGRENNQL